MTPNSCQRTAWALARAQHGVVTRVQLLGLGFSDDAIKHRLERGRLRPVHRGVYAVSQLSLTQEGTWMAAVLACGPTAVLSHESASALWKLTKATAGPTYVSVLAACRSRSGIDVHRRRELDLARRHGIPTTSVAQTLIDLGRHPQLEQAVSDAILRRLVTVKALGRAAAGAGKPGAPLRSLIERASFRVTQSELEREFLRLVERAGLPMPDTQTRFGRWRVDFFWPGIGLVVETDGGRFHATALQQADDRRRDQAHLRTGRTPLRLTHGQVFLKPGQTTALLLDVFTACECRQRSRSSMRAA